MCIVQHKYVRGKLYKLASWFSCTFLDYYLHSMYYMSTVSKYLE